jgi:hypothetical protein
MYMNRESTITNMCYTYRHDYGLIKSETGGSMSGMTEDERIYLWNTMAQIFDNDIAPYMEFKHVATARNTCGNE